MSLNTTSPPPISADNRAGAADYIMLAGMGLGWGLAVSMSKLAGQHGGHPIGLALWQVCVSGALLGMVAICFGGLPRPDRAVIRFGLVCGLCGVGFPAMALFWSALHLPAGIVAIAFASMPMFTYLLSVVFRLERPEFRRLAGVAIGLVAMLLMILPSSALPSPDLAPWLVLALAASVSMSIENFYAGAYRPQGATSLQLSCVRQLGAIVFLLPLAAATSTFMPLFTAWGTMQYAGTATAILSGVCYTALLVLIKRSGVVYASQTAYLITLAGVGWGMIIFGESHSGWVWLTLLLTLCGIALVKPRAPRAAGMSAHQPKVDPRGVDPL